MADIAAGMNFRNRPLPVPANEAVGQPAATSADFIALLKPRVMSLVVFSGWAGLMVAPGSMHPVLAAIALMCIAVSAGAAGAVNMWYDRDIDAIMSRTQARPIPQGRVTPDSALAFGVILQAASVVMMGLAVNWLAAGLLAFAAMFYVFVYTIWLKRRTPQNIVIGGAAGAFPPVIGWAAATGHVSWDAMALFALIFLWTPPHFWALALYRSGDYARAGVPMLPVVAGARTTKIQMVLYCILLVFVAPLPWMLGTAGLVYGITAITLSLVFLACAIAVFRRDDITLQKRMFGFSILYLFALFAVLVVDRAPGIVAGFLG